MTYPPPPPRGVSPYGQYPPTPGMEFYGAFAYQCPPPPGDPYWKNGSQYPPPPTPGQGMPVMPPYWYWNGSQYPPPLPPGPGDPGPGHGPGMPPYQYPPAVTGYPNIPPPNNNNFSSFMKGALLGKLIYEAADALTGSAGDFS